MFDKTFLRKQEFHQYGQNRTDIKLFYFVSETKCYSDDEVLDYRSAESVKIECVRRHFATISNSTVTYDVVKNYDELWDIITKL